MTPTARHWPPRLGAVPVDPTVDELVTLNEQIDQLRRLLDDPVALIERAAGLLKGTALVIHSGGDTNG